MGNKMNNQTGVEILSSILERMTYSNIVLSKNDADCPGVIDVKSLHNLLLKGCLENQIIPRSSKLCLVDRELSEEISFYVKTLTNKTITIINLKVTACAKDVKEEIMYKEGIPFDQQHLIYSGKQLDDGDILHDLGILLG